MTPAAHRKMNLLRQTCSLAQGLALSILLAASQFALAQSQLPSIEQTRLDAEKGDPKAQHQLAETYLSRQNYSAAFEWYQKAADQGILDSQYRLAQMLIEGKPKTKLNQNAIPKKPEEALEWFLRAGNKGHKLAQLELGRCYHTGKVVKQDIVEAYKWYKLIAPLGPMGDPYSRDNFVLAMTHDQVAEAEKRVKDWHPHDSTTEEIVQAAYLGKIALKGFASSGDRRMAVINSAVFQEGQEQKVTLGTKPFSIRCLQIKQNSVVINLEGLTQPKEISYK